MNQAQLQARIDATNAQIDALEAAILGLISGSILSYSLDTGQSVQKVTKQDIGIVQRVIDSLYNRCATLEARLNGGTVTARPAW